MLCAVRLPLEDKRCIIADAFPYAHIFHICVIGSKPLNAESFTSFIDDTDIIKPQDIQFDIHQVVQLFHVNHGDRILRCRYAAEAYGLLNGQVADKHTAWVGSDGNNSAVDNIHISENLRILFTNCLFMRLDFFADVVGNLNIVNVLTVFVEGTAHISNSSLQRNGVKGNDFCGTDAWQVHLVTKQEPFDCVSVLARVVRINICIGHTGGVHKAEEVQPKPQTVHLCNTKQIGNHTAGYRASSVTALDTVFIFPFPQICLQEHKVNRLCRLVDIKLFFDNTLQLLFGMVLQRIGMRLHSRLDFFSESLFRLCVNVRIFGSSIQLKRFHHICQQVCVFNGLHILGFR